MNEVEIFIPVLFDKSFNFDLDENINFDFENISYSKNNKQRIDRWRKQLKYMALDIYDIKISEQKLSLKNNKEFKLKSNSKILNESTELVKKNITQIFDLMNDLEKKDWFATYINSFVTQFDPHTYYFQPEDKERFDMNISGKFDGIGARDIIKIFSFKSQ